MNAGAFGPGPSEQASPYRTTMEALLDTTRLLWPSPAESSTNGTRRAGHEVVREFLLLPHRRQPRIALPVGSAAMVAEVLRKYSQGLTFAERVGRTTLSGLVRLPGINATLTRTVPHRLTVSAPAGHADGAFESYLSGILDNDVVIGVNLGQPRANRKPVVQALTADGRTLAFVKVGTSGASKRLVRGEAEALYSFWASGPPGDGLRVPRVIHYGQWRGLEVLVLSPLRPSSTRWRRRNAVPTIAMRALGTHLGTSSSILAEGPAWERAHAASTALADKEQAARFERIVAAVGARYGSTPLTVGAWHGDWTPWNMAWDGDNLLLWDFERFAAGVPLGFDLAHYHLQSVLRDRGEAAAGRQIRAELAAPDGAGRPVRKAMTSDADALAGNDPEAVLAGYLVELARRYVLASEPAEGTPLRARTEWLIALLYSLVVRR
ncbi:MAG TPA: phosphotransferase [Actinopolymorphaceae bacterium]|nr:phosphotransferase [Actinopolymorphaceae bacterium]